MGKGSSAFKQTNFSQSSNHSRPASFHTAPGKTTQKVKIKIKADIGKAQYILYSVPIVYSVPG